MGDSPPASKLGDSIGFPPPPLNFLTKVSSIFVYLISDIYMGYIKCSNQQFFAVSPTVFTMRMSTELDSSCIR